MDSKEANAQQTLPSFLPVTEEEPRAAWATDVERSCSALGIGTSETSAEFYSAGELNTEQPTAHPNSRQCQKNHHCWCIPSHPAGRMARFPSSEGEGGHPALLCFLGGQRTCGRARSACKWLRNAGSQVAGLFPGMRPAAYTCHSSGFCAKSDMREDKISAPSHDSRGEFLPRARVCVFTCTIDTSLHQHLTDPTSFL